MSQCDLSSCGGSYTDRKCNCYANLSVLPENPTKEQVNSTQFCAFESEDGFLYPCDVGCCKGGCPGQCANISPRPPQIPYVKRDQKLASKSPKVGPIVVGILVIMFLLMLATVLSLYIRA